MAFLNSIFRRFNVFELFIEAIHVFLGYFLLLFSYCMPRDKQKWAFGNKRIFKDNTKYLFLYLLANDKEIHPVWISSSRSLVKQLKAWSYPAYYKYSIKGLYHTLTAGVYVSTVNSNHINYFTSGRAFNVYLWHGIALKKMSGAKSLPGDGSLLSRISMPYAYEKVDFFLSTTPMIDEQFLENFNLSREALYAGMYPRCSFMLSDKEDLINYIKSYEDPLMWSILQKMKIYKKVFVYMPTWRINYGKNFIDYAIPDLYELNTSLSKIDALLLLKLHPSMRYDAFKYKDLDHIVYIDSTIDMYPILSFTDVIISDYSSIYFDYLLFPDKGVILYDFDVDTYIKTEFGFFRDYKAYTPGTHVSDFKSLLSTIESDRSFLISDEERSWILHEMWGDYQDKTPIDLVYAIKERLNK